MFNRPGWASLIDLNTAQSMLEVMSHPRLAAYGLITPEGTDAVGAIARHCRNITLCEAVYPVLHVLEVVMRNRIHDAFRSHYGADDWYSQEWLLQGHRHLVAKAHDDLGKRGKPLDPDHTIAALGFGFWCGMFHAGYESATGPWPRLLKAVLPRVPKSWRTRAKIQTRVEEARHLRNRVFHHESIGHAADLPGRYRGLIELLGWLSQEARQHVENICRFRAVYADRLTMAPASGSN